MNAKVESMHVVTTLPAVRPATVSSFALTPAQQGAYEKLEEVLSVSPIVGLVGPTGCGRTTIANALATKHGGRTIGMSEIFKACETYAGDKWEEAIEALVMEALADADFVAIDDYTSLNLISMLLISAES